MPYSKTWSVVFLLAFFCFSQAVVAQDATGKDATGSANGNADKAAEQLKQIAAMVIQLSAVEGLRSCGADTRALKNSFAKLLEKTWHIFSIAQRRQLLTEIDTQISTLKESDVFKTKTQEVSCERLISSVSGLKESLLKQSEKSADEKRIDTLDNNLAFVFAADKVHDCQQDFADFPEKYGELLKASAGVRESIVRDRLAIISAKAKVFGENKELSEKIRNEMTCEKVQEQYSKITDSMSQIISAYSK